MGAPASSAPTTCRFCALTLPSGIESCPACGVLEPLKRYAVGPVRRRGRMPAPHRVITAVVEGLARLIGGAFCLVGGLALAAFLIWALVVNASVAGAGAGFWPFVLVVVLLPVVLALAPVYAAIAFSDWTPALVTYLGPAVAFGVLTLGATLRR